MRIIHIDIDCLRPDHLGCYGYPRPITPNLDRIAARGCRFDHCYVSNSPCVPSRTAMLSGRFGIRNGVVSNHSAGADFHQRTTHYAGPHPDEMPFPRRLRQAGMDTISISNFPDRHSNYYWMAGFSEFITPNLKGGAESGEEINAVVLDWLGKNATRDGYYLHINYWDAHRTYRMGSEWRERLGGTRPPQTWPDEATIREHHRIASQQPACLFTAASQPGTQKTTLMPAQIASRQDFETMVDAYDTAIAKVDYHVGEVLDFLEQHGGLEQTAFIITADHGDAFGEHGIYTDHVCADECVHHVPLIIAWPGKTDGGRSSDGFVYLLDLAPTICELVGIAAPAGWDGASLVGNLDGTGGVDRPYLVWDHGLYTVQRAVRTRDHLLVRSYDDHGYPGFDPIALYDMRTDPHQTRNLIDQEPAVLGRHLRLLEEWHDAQRAKGCRHIDPVQAILLERAATKD